MKKELKTSEFIKSSLSVKPSKKLQEEIERDLKIPDTEKAAARLKELLNTPEEHPHANKD